MPLVKEVAGQGHALARIIGSDGHTLWCDATGLFGVRLNDHSIVKAEDLQEANPTLDARWWSDPRGMDIIDGRLHVTNDDRSAGLDVDPITLKALPGSPRIGTDRFNKPEITDHFAAGFIASPGTWIGVHAVEELEGEFQEGKWVRAIESAEDAKRSRRLFSGVLEPSDDGTPPHPFHATDQRHRSPQRGFPAPARQVRTTTCASTRERIDGTHQRSRPRWNTGRFARGPRRPYPLELRHRPRPLPPTTDPPRHRCLRFVGNPPAVEGKLSEPMVVLVDNVTGKLTRHSLWR
ncbi:MAG: hypothetical protein IPO05_08525 [Flavobacteriales bacterium]|nr:hypothetical protein [Flavobacteriales bacterium]